MVQIKHSQQGLALLLTLVTVSAIITITLSLIGLTLQQLELSVDARDSERAFHAASAGLECGQAYVNNYEKNYGVKLSESNDGDPVQPIQCMGDSDSVLTDKDTFPNATIHIFSYQLEANLDGPTCLDIDIYIITAENLVTRNIPGQTGDVDCDKSSICSVVVSRGYNQACSAPSANDEVMRELNAIF